jgi:hypothetical protein
MYFITASWYGILIESLSQCALRYNPKKIAPTYKNVRFPYPKFDSHGTLNFTVPRGAKGRWAFAVAFIKKGDSFPAQPPVEVSNGFTLH